MAKLTVTQAEGYRMHLRSDMVKHGERPLKAWRQTSVFALGREELEIALANAVAATGMTGDLPALPVEVATGSTGIAFDGHILKAIIDAIDQFSKTPFGAAVIAALEQIILHMLIP